MGKVIEKIELTNIFVLAEPIGATPLVGQVVLELLDLLIDPKSRKLIPNPKSPEMPMREIS